MQKAFLMTTVAALTVMGCKKDDTKDTTRMQDTFHDQSYYVIEPGNLERGPSLLKGSGVIVMGSPLSSIQSENNFALEFSLEEGGSLALVAQSNDSLEQGITVQFDRAGTELTTSLKVDGSGTSDKVLEGMDASGTISLSVDIHNNETPAHILMWDAATGSFSEDDAIYNSEVDEETSGNGQATLWGLVLRNAELKAVTLDSAKFSDE